MPSTLSDWLLSLDAFGEPVSVNYNGSTTYKTHIGSLLTLGMRGFMLIFTLTGVLALLDYKNPQINQYRIYDERVDGREVNMGQAQGFLMFGLFNTLTNSFFVNDPKIVEMKAFEISIDWNSENP